MRLQEQANPWGRVWVRPLWYWCLHRRSLRCLSSRHLWGCEWEWGRQEENCHAVEISPTSALLQHRDCDSVEAKNKTPKKKNPSPAPDLSFCRAAAIISPRPVFFWLLLSYAYHPERAMAYLCWQTEHQSAVSWNDTLSWMMSHMWIWQGLFHCWKLFLQFKFTCTGSRQTYTHSDHDWIPTMLKFLPSGTWVSSGLCCLSTVYSIDGVLLVDRGTRFWSNLV